MSLQAYIKLGDYRKALVDCEWALKVRRLFPLPHAGAGLAGARCLSPEVNRGELPVYHGRKGCRLCSQSLSFLICKMGTNRIVVRVMIMHAVPCPWEVLWRSCC